MSDKPISLDSQRGMAEQKATEIRRRLAEVISNEEDLRQHQAELETRLLEAPAATWRQAAEKAVYLLGVLAASPAGQDPRRRKLIEAAIADFERLDAEA